MNVKTIEKNLKLAKSALPFASRTVQSSLPPKLKHVEVILAACQEVKASMLKCYIKCRSSVHDMIQFRRTLSMPPPGSPANPQEIYHGANCLLVVRVRISLA